MMRIALGLSYDGGHAHGWQTQPDKMGLQDTLQKALANFLNQDHVATVCAGRTDTGVHALQQVVHLDTSAQRSEYSWVKGLNSFLPSYIAVQWARSVNENFHARFSARQRTYFYLLHNTPIRSPILAGRVGWSYERLDLHAMRSAAACLIGKHDFSAFRSAQCQAKNPVRNIFKLDISVHGSYYLFHFSADAFLHHMIRNLMGCLLLIGKGKHPPGWLAEVLQARQRRLAAPTFMPDGLYMAHVQYAEEFMLPLLPARVALEHHLGNFGA